MGNSGKKAQGHVEIMLATILFLLFLIFIFVFLSTVNKPIKPAKITDLQEKIIAEMSSEIGVLSVIVNTPSDCYNLSEVEDKYGTNFIEVQDLNNPRKYTIYYGDFFYLPKVGSIGCSSPMANYDFELGLYTEEIMLVHQKIVDLRATYLTNYGPLKQSMDVGDFSFKFKNLTGDQIYLLSINGSDEKIPDNVGIVAKDIPVRVMDENAEISELILNIRGT